MNEQEKIKKALSVLHASENTLEEVIKKADPTKPYRKICCVKKLAFIAAALVTMCFPIACAAAAIKWNGFAFIDGMSNSEKNALIQSGSTTAHAELYTDADGNVHYFDESGNETLVLSEKEATEYEIEKEKTREQDVIDSTLLVDVSTITPVIPASITEVASQSNGHFSDFALGNGHMILLYPEDEDGYKLKRGNIVTITVDSDKDCILEFGKFKDGVFVDSITDSAQKHQYTYNVEEDGRYCFYITHYSAGVELFTNCNITINE